ncbi:MAG: UDP-glucose 6-dehydrogenase [Flammeovirgaceae bacterium TMED32]|nr:MAG: UDP-glucose 6-dehydrogenase [Flammeovirgaceae bacterium TMED32]
MKIAVVGTGYVGLVTGTCFAETGNYVSCIDIDAHKIKKLKTGAITIYEPGLEPLFQRNLNQKRLFFTTDLAEGIKGAEIIFLALPTPPGEDGSADLQYVLKVALELGELLDHYTIIVDKSTVPVGTAAKVNQAIAKKAKVSFDVVSNPEFLREGVAVDDFMKPDRVVIGSASSQAEAMMKQLYAPFVRQGNPIIFMDIKSAELTKYAANAFLATKITFMNEIANLCSLLGADVDAVRQGIGTDTRIGKQFLFAGTGYGGSCFPKDVQALSKSAQEVAYAFDMLKNVIKVNDQQKIKLIEPIESYLGSIKGKTIAIWGLAFKPYTDDIREAPALANIDLLLEKGATLRVYDPEAMKSVRELMGDQIYYAEDQYDALEDADTLMIMTEWPVFRTPNFSIIGSKMKNKAIFDGRNLYGLNQMKKLSFTYYSIGREFIQN